MHVHVYFRPPEIYVCVFLTTAKFISLKLIFGELWFNKSMVSVSKFKIST